ncbi:MAG: hypothetical protein QMC83_07855 [Thermodesulfovibrionales bacterium]|nr:hypothetical protein [Thermodesulfovibrionales bacterium]
MLGEFIGKIEVRSNHKLLKSFTVKAVKPKPQQIEVIEAKGGKIDFSMDKPEIFSDFPQKPGRDIPNNRYIGIDPQG